MNIKSKIIKRKGKPRKDGSVGPTKWVVRIEYFDEIAGRSRYMERHADLRAAAIDERDRLVNEIKKTLGQSHDGERMTFGKLAAIYKEHFYKPAIVVQGRKVAGIRSHRTVAGHLAMLEEFFGSRMLRHITPESLSDYRLWRIEKGSRRGKPENKRPISLATVNRELSSLRSIMSYAYEKGWISKELSFRRVIDKDAEHERTRILTPEEEIRLLEACQGQRSITYERTRGGRVEHITAKHDVDNPHLKAILLLAIDSGLRRNEILKLEWKDFDFDKGLIHVLETHTKSERPRLAPLTQRTVNELQRVRLFTRGERPFPFKNFDHSFATAKKVAGITDLRFHDLRRSAITRWVIYGTPLNLAGKAAGHSQLQTTHRHYLAADESMISEIARSMDAAQGRVSAVVDTENEMLN